MKTLGLHPKGEYDTRNTLYIINDSKARCEIVGYESLLVECGTRLEDALEWFYNKYIADEFGITGFSISLPTTETNFLDCCKSIGPEIERVLKAYKLYAQKGTIDSDYFPYVEVGDFSQIPSLSVEKYYVEGPGFEEASAPFVSDQSLLAYSEAHPGSYSSFFDMILKCKVKINDYPHQLRQYLYHALDIDMISIDEGFIEPTEKACILYFIWNNGAFPIRHYPESDKEICEKLVKDGILKRSPFLLTPDEADYATFIFNDKKFCNAIALRNKYSHGSDAISDPNSKDIVSDYYRLLLLLIAITDMAAQIQTRLKPS